MSNVMRNQMTRVGCGAAIVKDGKILLVQRRQPPEAGHWGIPGGKVDWMEPIEQAVRREILEEVQLTLKDIELLGVVDQLDKAEHEHWIAVVYKAITLAGTPRLCEPEKHVNMRWFDLRDLPHPITQVTKEILPVLINS